MRGRPIVSRSIDSAAAAERGTAAPLPPVAVEDGWFAAAMCRNCGAARDTPYCRWCGQKAVQRYDLRDLGKETWERIRLFEIRAPRTLARLAVAPGTVAREHVLGRRAAYTHPLTLLVALVALLVVLLAANQYFGHYGFAGRDGDVDRMAQRVIAYANWSFSLGIVALFVASATVFHGRLGYNLVEHAVLAVYVQAVVLALIIVNLLPTLVWRDPGFIVAHKAASAWYVPALKLLIAALALHQFFLLDLRRDWWRLALACLVFGALSWLLLRAYAAAILWVVTHT